MSPAATRIAILPAATAADLGGFVRGPAKPGARIIADGLKSYDGLADSFRHYSIVQDGGKNADAVLPIVHVLFSNVKTWLNGTFHGVSAKHLPRYAREWSYRFNRRRRIADLTDFLLRRAATRPTMALGGRPPRDDGQIGTSVGRAIALPDVECRDRPP